MADHQKIHPIHDDVESQKTKPTAPLVPPGTIKSDGRHPYDKTSPYVRQGAPLRPPKKRRNCCCRFLCWTICLIFLLIIAVAATIGILYLVFQPKLPNYSVDHLKITEFTINPDSSLTTTFTVTITAINPNTKIGIYYEGGSHISVSYEEIQLCEGPTPKFYQGHENTTVLSFAVTGQTKDANGLLTRISEQHQRTGNVPLDLSVKQPVRIRFGALKVFEVNFSGRCLLKVDSMSADNDIRVQSSSCKFKFSL